MAEPTSTRTELRRALCQELHMPFMRMTGGYSSVGASPTTLSIRDSILTQPDNYWNGQWWYHIEHDEHRKIVKFTAALDELKFEYPVTLPVTYSAGPPEVLADTYEIHSIFNAGELHWAINRAIEDSFPAFFDYVTDETIIIKENTLKYSLTSLTQLPWKMCKVFMENNDTKLSGVATSGSVSTLVDSLSPFTAPGVTTGWQVSIYAGTGAGQIRTVSSATGTTLNVSANWTTTPDSTSKYTVWNPDSQILQWEQILAVGFDSPEYPSFLYFGSLKPENLGLRLRLEYTSRPLPLTTNISTTVVPKEFIINKALSFLFGQKVNDNRVDRTRYANLEEYRRQLSEQYRINRTFNQPTFTQWQPPTNILQTSLASGNPFER